ncbi:hypothetical protein ScPMuIL_017653 [Solemya velum]
MAGGIEEPDGSKSNDSPSTINLTRIRERIRSYIDEHQYKSALFWADKVVSLSNGAVEDVYWYAQCLYHTGQYHRASHVICSRKLDRTELACRYLAAKCHYKCNEWQEALNIIDMVDVSCMRNPTRNLFQGGSFTESKSELSKRETNQSIHLLRGKIYESMDNRNLAMDCFREALREDVYCYEAFDLLVSHNMLSSQEEQDLINSLPFMTQCPDEELELVKFLYENKLKKYHKPKDLKVPESLSPMNENLDVVVNLAERYYYNCEIRECYKITTKILSKDCYNSTCLPLHIAVLVELLKPNELFYLAHKLVDLYPNKPVSWFAVGCYYLLTDKSELARRYLSKATNLDRVYGPAWLAFGHSFAADNEHDQAMAAYFTASQLMKGCHLPLLYIGLEYGLTNNFKLADKFFNQALSVAPEDPFVLHEMGVIAFKNQDWITAEKYFKIALEKVQSVTEKVMFEKWEPLLNNLGHTCRKRKNYEAALEYHRQARLLAPQNPSTYSAIAYCHVLMGDNLQAVDYYHKALGIRRDDAFSTTMLGQVIEALVTEMSPCQGVPDELPPFEGTGRLDILNTTSKTEEEDSAVIDSSSMLIEEVDMEGSD